MKILHCCLACFYIDGYSYQENILPKYHQRMGHDVQIVASRLNYENNKVLTLSAPGSYMNEDGIQVTRLDYASAVPNVLRRKIRLYKGFKSYLNTLKPEAIFLHDVNFASLLTVANYCRRNPGVQVVADSHTDHVNSGSNWWSRKILHGLFYRTIIQLADRHIKQYYGTTPIRCNYLSSVYGVRPSKVALLPFGADDDVLFELDMNKLKSEFRQTWKIPESSLIVVSGGKIDRRKNIHELIQACSNFDMKDLVLVVFGTPDDEMEKLISSFIAQKNLILLGWQNTVEIYKTLLIADLAVFPGTHSVLWEQAVGSGIPCIFKNWEGMTHVDVGGNCHFVETGSAKELKAILNSILKGEKNLTQLTHNSRTLGPQRFSYSRISQNAIELFA